VTIVNIFDIMLNMYTSNGALDIVFNKPLHLSTNLYTYLRVYDHATFNSILKM